MKTCHHVITQSWRKDKRWSEMTVGQRVTGRMGQQFCHSADDVLVSYGSLIGHVRWPTVISNADTSVEEWYGIGIGGITAVLGSKYAGIPWEWGPGLWGWVNMDCELMHELGSVQLQVSVD